VAASHPQDNEIPDSVNVRNDLTPNVNVAHSVEEERREAGARLNLGQRMDSHTILPFPQSTD